MQGAPIDLAGLDCHVQRPDVARHQLLEAQQQLARPPLGADEQRRIATCWSCSTRRSWTIGKTGSS